jgi:hypothetical protein
MACASSVATSRVRSGYWSRDPGRMLWYMFNLQAVKGVSGWMAIGFDIRIVVPQITPFR